MVLVYCNVGIGLSTLRSRQQKRKAERSPAVWRGSGRAAERPAVEHGVRGQVGISWRMVSGLIVLGLSAVLVLFFVSDAFYVRSVVVLGTNYLDEAEVFRYADIAETHVFWVDPAAVRRNIIDSSSVIADARVVVGWPPNMIKIVVEEREPALIWVQEGITALVDLQGRVLRYPPETEVLPDLMQVIADNNLQGPPGVDAPISQDAVSAALQLRTLLAGLPLLRYNATKGLGFREGEWDVWLGTGTDMHNKLLVYEALRDNLQARGITPVEINVANDVPYYCGSLENCR